MQGVIVGEQVALAVVKLELLRSGSIDHLLLGKHHITYATHLQELE